MVPIVILMIWIGVYPKPYLRPMEASVNYWLTQVQQASVQRDAATKPPSPPVVHLQVNPMGDAPSKED
jgi:hypothetical protein